MANNLFDRVEKRIDSYHRGVEQWKIDHDDAMECLDLELILQEGLSIYDAINHFDEKWRSIVYDNPATYDREADDLIRKAYERWLTISEWILKSHLIEEHQQRGFQVEYADKLRAACREVRGILADDAEFFSSERLVELRDEAVDEFRRGECQPLGE